ncbi:hypothetical protein BDR05DRAFT_966386 [Suillus weaverae]|nr:hypothetical protein BDR05DRAFT_966386 [Suillus weaverae]
MPERTIEGHSMCVWSLAYWGTSCNIMSPPEDGSIRQWTRDGETVGKPWDIREVGVNLRATSPGHNGKQVQVQMPDYGCGA